MKITGDWMQPFVARATFNLGYMYHFGLGVPRDTSLARSYYRRCFDVDPTGVQLPVTLMLGLLAFQINLVDMPSFDAAFEAYVADVRPHLLAIIIVLLCVLFRAHFSLLRAPAAVREGDENANAAVGTTTAIGADAPEGGVRARPQTGSADGA